jgi:uncharacterized protein (DUF342 family)
VRSDGSIDFRARCLLTPVTPGALVGAYLEPTTGVDGLGVTGRAIPASPGRDRRPPVGDGLNWTETGELRALVAGIICQRAGGLLDVSEHVEHRGDVDMRSGDLDVGKSLVITGSVRWGMIVRAQEELRVLGDVEGGTVTARGDARIVGAVIGSPKSVVAAEGSLSVGRAQGATLRCGGLLEISGDAVSSELSDGEVVIEGRMIGGSANAEKRLFAREAGGESQTVLRVAVPVGELEQHLKQLISEARWRRAARAQRGSTRSVGPRGARKRGRVARESRIPDDARAAHALENRQQIEELAKSAVIEVDRAHGGLEVLIAGRRAVLDEPLELARMFLSTVTDKVVVEKRK